MRLLVALLLLATTLAASTVRAQDLEPRTYTNTPVGLNFLIAGYAYQQGDIVTDPGLPIEDAEVSVHGSVLAYAHAFGLFGKSAKVDLILPYSWVSGSATFQGRSHERDVDGLGDPRVRLAVNLVGAPALALEDFASYRQDFVFGASLQILVPAGQYDSSRLLNIGANRWAFKPELGISKTVGPLTLEVAPSMTFYTDNDDFLGDIVREQDPIYAVQAHLVYRFGEAFWAAVDGTYYGGGQTTIDGVEADDRQANARVGLTLALSVSRRNSLKLYASKGAVTRIAGEFETIGLAWQYRWGGGL